VSAGTSYTFWVAAKNFIDGVGDISDTVSVLAASPPADPAAPSVTATYNTVSLTWVAPDSRGVSIDSYQIYWDSDGNLSDDFTLLDSTSNLFYNINTGVSQGINYKFKILAENSVGPSGESPIGSALAASEPAKPSAPIKLSADTTSITVQWIVTDSRGSEISNYHVYWDAGAGGDPRTLLTTTSNSVFTASTTLAIPDLTDGATYKFAVIAENALGNS